MLPSGLWPSERSVRSRCRPIYTSRLVPARETPPDLDELIERAANQAGMSYSGWLAATARKEFIVQAGLKEVAQFERDHGAFTAAELDDAEQWAERAVTRAKRSGARRRKSA